MFSQELEELETEYWSKYDDVKERFASSEVREFDEPLMPGLDTLAFNLESAVRAHAEEVAEAFRTWWNGPASASPPDDYLPF